MSDINELLDEISTVTLESIKEDEQCLDSAATTSPIISDTKTSELWSKSIDDNVRSSFDNADTLKGEKSPINIAKQDTWSVSKSDWCTNVSSKDLDKLTSFECLTEFTDSMNSDNNKIKSSPEIEINDDSMKNTIESEISLNDKNTILLSDIVDLNPSKDNFIDMDKDEDYRDNKDPNALDISDDSSSMSSSSSDSDSDVPYIPIVDPVVNEVHHVIPDLKFIQELPSIDLLQIKVPDDIIMKPVGTIRSTIQELVIVDAYAESPPLDIDSVLFLDNKVILGQVFETFGPVKSPLYSIRFNSVEEIKDMNIENGMTVFFAPDETKKCTQYVFTKQLMSVKGSDASWENNREPPHRFLDYSDDEIEREHKKKKKNKNAVEKNIDEEIRSNYVQKEGKNHHKEYKNNNFKEQPKWDINLNDPNKYGFSNELKQMGNIETYDSPQNNSIYLPRMPMLNTLPPKKKKVPTATLR